MALLIAFTPTTLVAEDKAPIPVYKPIPEIPPILEEIARCESGGRQFKENGEVIRGVINSQDVGKFQINEKYHLAKSKELGMDIYTEQGNTAYALWLYKNQGTTPWNWSKGCWSK